ncbi:MAG: DUF86 domain-containing protein [Candidatus Thermoplasmatota archaeon]|nr:DUF86 domain-containing protein [Candidatus Thermoplasmatota archaeon]
MKRDYKIFLQDILRSIEHIEGYTEGMDIEAFRNDQKTVDAVIRNLEIIGEATKNIPIEFRRKYPDIPWREMAGTRDKLTHGYFDIVYEILWETVKNDLPKIKPKIKKILDKTM